ncbi:MAG: DJ-1/PfpI family protein [Candidatus Hydrogenedentes bacterium]|nr:DJ-1/PfpI family protein [Candidatus Hydrogenedentota bacterium]
MPKALVPLAQGCEELEAVTIIDLLRRANIEVVTAGLTSEPVTASRSVVIVPDMTLEKAVLLDDLDMIVLPGGLPGADNLGDSPLLVETLKRFASEGRFVAAICAAPRVLAKTGLLDGRRATAYPGFINGDDFPNISFTGASVEIDGNVITSRGPGTAMDFALTLIEQLTDRKTRNTVEAGLVR